MSDDDNDPIHLLSTTLFKKEWGVALPPSVVEIFEALLSNGSHVRSAIDARIRRSSSYSEGLESSPWEEHESWPAQETSRLGEQSYQEPSSGVQETEHPRHRANVAALEYRLAAKNLPATHTLGSLLDLLVAYGVVTLDARGEYSINPLAPHALEALSSVGR